MKLNTLRIGLAINLVVVTITIVLLSTFVHNPVIASVLIVLVTAWAVLDG